MKKMLSMLLALLTLFSCCAVAEEAVQIAALKGPTAMGMVQMMRDGGDTYEFTLAGSADEIVPLLIQGKLDIAAVPANLASILYNNTKGTDSEIHVMAINTLGVLYLVERGDTLESVKDLRGRTIISAGKGSTPEYALNYILRENGLEPGVDVTIEYVSEHSECLARILNDSTLIAMLPQPFCTIAQSKAEDMRIALDLTEEWETLQADSENPSAMITGVVVARKDFIENHSAAIEQFMTDYAASVAFTQESVSDAAQLIGEYDIFDAAVAEKALPYCNIVFIAGEEMRTLLDGYLAELYAQDSASIGGELPDETFYYE